MKDTKTIILEKSLELFANRNYEAVSMSELCAATSLTKGAIYHHFKSKSDIYKGAIDFLVDRILMDLDCNCQAKSFVHFIEDGITYLSSAENADILSANISFPIKCVFMLYGAHRFYPNFETVGEKVYRAHIALWETVLTHTIEIGDLSPDTDVRNMARICQSISAGIFSKALLNYEQGQILNDLKSQYMALYQLMKK